ncbi:MAG: hypothetical protein WCO92_06780, partial [Verrucomicrobiota bacterium]
QFHLHVGPASFYGISCAALAWFLMIQGCRQKKTSLVFGGYLFLGMILSYKAQLFVANAFILLLFPCFFFLQCDKKTRALVAATMTFIFFSIVAFSQRYSFVPIIRLNGGGMHKYFKMLSLWTERGALHSFLLEHLWQHPLPFPCYHLLAGTTLYFCTLGIWGFGVMVALFFLRRKVDAIVWSFPCWVIINYLVMSLGLSLNSRDLGHGEELVNRPLMWAYFAIATWTAGALYFLFWGSQLPKTIFGRVAACLMLLGSLAAPLFFAHGLQTMPMWNLTLKSNAVPAAMVGALDFIRQESSAHDLVQDSKNDPLCVVAGLVERQGYLMIDNANTEEGKMDPVVAERLKALEAFKQMTTESELKTFIQSHSISWYLLRPESKVAWPDSFKSNTVFQTGGYRVYYWAQ